MTNLCETRANTDAICIEHSIRTAKLLSTPKYVSVSAKVGRVCDDDDDDDDLADWNLLIK